MRAALKGRRIGQQAMQGARAMGRAPLLALCNDGARRKRPATCSSLLALCPYVLWARRPGTRPSPTRDDVMWGALYALHVVLGIPTSMSSALPVRNAVGRIIDIIL